jgi:hypothetical protein
MSTSTNADRLAHEQIEATYTLRHTAAETWVLGPLAKGPLSVRAWGKSVGRRQVGCASHRLERMERVKRAAAQAAEKRLYL